jgi:FkbM family methyltransferase
MNSMDGFRTLKSKGRLGRFLQKPWREKTGYIFFCMMRAFPGIVVPVRLPFGGWWLARNDFVGSALLNGGFENTERSFVEHFLRPGMTVLDIGAHHGFYTLMASRKVGSQGRVIAVEASQRERDKLHRHLRMNGCKNVCVVACALGEAQGTAELYLVGGGETGCNSLRPPDVARPTTRIAVSVETLDGVLQSHKVDRVDFIKMDVEGAEFSVLKGARELLNNRPRPAILIEVYDIRTRPWGYAARDIVRYLTALEYHWFSPLPGGKIEELNPEKLEYAGNFVAVPIEGLARVQDMIIDAKHHPSTLNAQRSPLIS